MRLLLLALVAVLLADAASAQRRHRPFAEKGDVALTARIQGLSDLRLGSALGGIGIRYRVGDQSVLGTSVGFNVNDIERDDAATDTQESTANGANVAVWTERHLGSRRRTISPFVAFGVQGQFARRASESSVTNVVCSDGVCEDVRFSNEIETDSYRLGVGAGLGAEARIVRGVTLGAAYTVGASYTWDDTDRRSVGPGEPRDESYTTTYLAAGTGTTAFYLSVYF